MRLLISGYRKFSDYHVIETEMKKILAESKETDHVIIHGNCSGVDLTADRVAKNCGWSTLIFPAQWDYYAKKGCRNAAGPMRNQQMIAEGKPDYALLFLAPESVGTLDMLARLDKSGIEYSVVYI